MDQRNGLWIVCRDIPRPTQSPEIPQFLIFWAFLADGKWLGILTRRSIQPKFNSQMGHETIEDIMARIGDKSEGGSLNFRPSCPVRTSKGIAQFRGIMGHLRFLTVSQWIIRKYSNRKTRLKESNILSSAMNERTPVPGKFRCTLFKASAIHLMRSSISRRCDRARIGGIHLRISTDRKSLKALRTIPRFRSVGPLSVPKTFRQPISYVSQGPHRRDLSRFSQNHRETVISYCSLPIRIASDQVDQFPGCKARKSSRPA
jgi:hypothetical protein